MFFHFLKIELPDMPKEVSANWNENQSSVEIEEESGSSRPSKARTNHTSKIEEVLRSLFMGKYDKIGNAITDMNIIG